MSNLKKAMEMCSPNASCFVNPDFEDAIIGVTLDGGLIYDYDLMVKEMSELLKPFQEELNIDDEDLIMEATDHIDYDTLSVIPAMQSPRPIIARRMDIVEDQ